MCRQGWENRKMGRTRATEWSPRPTLTGDRSSGTPEAPWGD